eukprot:GHUV01009921.1.p2 GENE.GHUV01009921.1~~GHUV01009921.1.p2  ORF type:complete len:172 (+),score=41.37 GHUV01009921.1:129-644(+)
MECDIIQSPNDKKLYRYLTLSNGLSALLIHDPAVAEALAAEDGNKQQQAGKQEMDVSEDDPDASGSEDAQNSSSADADDSGMSESGSDAAGSEEDSEAGSEGGGDGKAKAAGSKKVGLEGGQYGISLILTTVSCNIFDKRQLHPEMNSTSRCSVIVEIVNCSVSSHCRSDT